MQKEKIITGKFGPPPEAAKRMVDNDKAREPRNPILKFLKKFFMGEGY